MTDLAIILVHYRTPDLLVEAVHALLADLAAAHLEAEILVVDNGSDPAQRSAWRDLPLRRIDPGSNLGYAGGVRRGVEASQAPYIVAMNPDVLVVTGCLGHLHDELSRGTAAAGPQFFWDRERRVLLPPTEKRSATAELRAALARRFPGVPALAATARGAWRRHARRHWEASVPLVSPELSGALLAFRRDAWMKIGPFDDVFRLYFEESDWLLRLAAAGLRSHFVPAAQAVHLFAQSSVAEPRSQAWFAEAERLFRRRHLSAGVVRLLDALAAPARRPLGRPDITRDEPGPLALPSSVLATRGTPEWIEIALSAGGFPAAGERLVAPLLENRMWQMPEEIWRRLPPGDLWIRGVDRSGGESPPTHVGRSLSSLPAREKEAE